MITITPRRVTEQEFGRHGITARFTGFAAHEHVSVGWGASNVGGQIVNPKTAADGGYFVADKHGRLTVRFRPAATQAAAGTYTLTGYGAVAANGSQAVVQVHFSVRAASNLRLTTAKRTGHHIRLSAVASRWLAVRNSNVAWSGATVRFQESFAGLWVTVATAKTDWQGRATARVTGAKHIWRAVVDGGTHTWSSTSGTAKK